MEKGNRVHLKNENTDGYVVEKNGSFYMVVTDDEFYYYVNESDLYEVNIKDIIRNWAFSGDLARIIVPDKDLDRTLCSRVSQGKRMKEVDLHSEKLICNRKGLSNHDIHKIQLKTIMNELDSMNNKPGFKVLFIHGKGSGVLRNELRSEVKSRGRRYSYRDADVEKAGFEGGTVVSFR